MRTLFEWQLLNSAKGTAGTIPGLRGLLKMLTPVGAALSLFCSTYALALAGLDPPVPIWPGEGNVPKSYRDRKVFLSPDEHSVVLLWPNQSGTGSKPVTMPLHNAIAPELRVNVERHSGTFVYAYNLDN